MVQGGNKAICLENPEGAVKGRWHIKAAAFLFACFVFLWGIPPECRAEDAGVLTLDVADGSVTITSQGYYIGDSQQLNPYTGNYIFTGETAENSVLVESFDVDRSITLNGLSIDVSGKNGQAAFRIAETCGEDVQLLLSGTNILKGGSNAAGLEYPAKTDRDNKAKLILDSASGSGSLEGSLEAYAGGRAAGIGGGGVRGTATGDGSDPVWDLDQPLFCGHMEIRGGTITATADPNVGYGGAGLGTGGGLKGANGDDPEWDTIQVPGSITVLGGKVTAVGGGADIGGAGIGTGSVSGGGYGVLLPILISGGDISATGRYGGAGIGGGSNCCSGEITIMGGSIAAKGGSDGVWSGAGIGGGDMSFSNEITIGGTAVVVAQGGSAAAGIGGGQDGECGGPIVLEDQAQVTAYGGSYEGRYAGAGVGAGQSYYIDARFLEPLTVRGSASLTAYSGVGAMAVGVGKDYTGESDPAPVRIESENVEIKLFNRDTVRPACPAAEGEFAGRLLTCTLEPETVLPAAGERVKVPGTADCEWSYTGESGNYSISAFQGETGLGTVTSSADSLGNWAVLTGENIEQERPVVPTPTPVPPTVEPEPEPEFPFEDVPPETWYRESVEFVWKLGMVEGVTPESYVPGSKMERGMVAVMLYRLEGNPESVNGGFVDVEDSAYYAAAAAWGQENGIVLGYGGGVFGPKDRVTREQLASVLYRYAVYRGWDVAGSGSLERFEDSDKASDWAKEALEWAVRVGVLQGYDDGTLKPGEDATRAEVAQMFMRFCTKYL